MFVRLWKVKNNNTKKIKGKVRFVFERTKEFMKIEGGALFEEY